VTNRTKGCSVRLSAKQRRVPDGRRRDPGGYPSRICSAKRRNAGVTLVIER
jgi:hypothetical protein